MQTENPKIGIIGCGAATEKLHLPALATLRLTPHLLVDPNLQRAQQLAEKFNVARVAETYESSIDGIDAAIIAVPHHLHARVSSDLLRRGIHVLVEKPLAPTEAECREVVEAARASGAVLAVGLMRRFLNRIEWVKSALDAGVLGPLQSFDIREGFVYRWPVCRRRDSDPSSCCKSKTGCGRSEREPSRSWAASRLRARWHSSRRAIDAGSRSSCLGIARWRIRRRISP
ncbi:MAG: Gfo/Idh/MocA family oxidoreductase [Acidobacteria bacterium]|nr:Gfo/Idh/MocA family oxidoreductase [Acidobacteriota bacterium]